MIIREIYNPEISMDSASLFLQAQEIVSMTHTLREWDKPSPPATPGRDVDVLMKLAVSVSALGPYPEEAALPSDEVLPTQLRTPSLENRVLIRESLQGLVEQLSCSAVNRRVHAACASVVDQRQREQLEGLSRAAQLVIDAIDRFSIQFFKEDLRYRCAVSPEEAITHRATHLIWARGFLKKSVMDEECLRLVQISQSAGSWWNRTLGELLYRWPELESELPPIDPILVDPILTERFKSYRQRGSEDVPLLKQLDEIAKLSGQLDQSEKMSPDEISSVVTQLDTSIRKFAKARMLLTPTLVEAVRILECLTRIQEQLQVLEVENAVHQLASSKSSDLPDIVRAQISTAKWGACNDLYYDRSAWQAVSFREMSSHWETYSSLLRQHAKFYDENPNVMDKLWAKNALKETNTVARCLDGRIKGWRKMTLKQLAEALSENSSHRPPLETKEV